MTLHDPNLHPRQLNTLGRPPGTLNTSDPTVREVLQSPRLVEILRNLQKTAPEFVTEFLTDARQVKRALNQDRCLVGDYTGDSRYPTEAIPFLPKEQHRPDRQPGSDAYKLMRGAVETLDASMLSEKLQSRMGTDTRPNETTWDRMGSASERPTQRDNGEPSIRDALIASSSLDYHREE